jgi:hypothetical protein
VIAIAAMVGLLLVASILSQSDFPLRRPLSELYVFVLFLVLSAPFAYTCVRLTTQGFNTDESASSEDKKRYIRWMKAIWRRYWIWGAAIVLHFALLFLYPALTLCGMLVGVKFVDDPIAIQIWNRVGLLWLVSITLFCNVRLFSRNRYNNFIETSSP